MNDQEDQRSVEMKADFGILFREGVVYFLGPPTDKLELFRGSAQFELFLGLAAILQSAAMRGYVSEIPEEVKLAAWELITASSDLEPEGDPPVKRPRTFPNPGPSTPS